jgi:putative hydrolase of the HAD superfamily
LTLRPSPPAAILFDLDDTLLSSYRNPRAAWDAIVGEQGLDLDPLTSRLLGARIAAHTGAYLSDPDRRRGWRLQPQPARRAVVRAAFAELGLDDIGVADLIADRYDAYRHERMHLLPDAHRVLDVLRRRGVRLALVTNGSARVQREKIARFGLTGRFDHFQIEGEAGYGKPDHRAYGDALRALAVSPDAAWMVGDDLEWDVAAPQQLGLSGIWHDVDRSGIPAGATTRPDRIIGSLVELLD